MKRGLRWLLLVAWLGAGAAWAETTRGVVIVVIDGDTVLFRPEHVGARSRAFQKLRLAHIDAPEKDQPGGEAATQALSALALKQTVDARIVAIDGYGRAIAELRQGERDINAEMVRLGHAWVTSRRPPPEFDDALGEARQMRRGLWAAPDAVPPRQWRDRR